MLLLNYQDHEKREDISSEALDSLCAIFIVETYLETQRRLRWRRKDHTDHPEDDDHQREDFR